MRAPVAMAAEAMAEAVKAVEMAEAVKAVEMVVVVNASTSAMLPLPCGGYKKCGNLRGNVTPP